MKQEIMEAICKLRRNSTSAYLSYVDAAGYPVTRAMLVLEHDLLGTQYFSTNTSSGKGAGVALRAMSKACSAVIWLAVP